MMEPNNPKAGLDLNFRQNALKNLILKTLKEWSRNSQDPRVIRNINSIAVKFEQRIFEISTSKDDYITKVKQKMIRAKSKLIDALTPGGTGNQPVSTASQRQVVSSCPTQQKPVAAPVMSIQQRDVTQPVLNKFHQGWEFGQQNVSLEREQLHFPVYQQSRSINEPLQTSNSMLNMGPCQQSMEAVHQLSNLCVPHMPVLASSPHPLHPVISSQEQRNHVQDGRMLGSQLHSQNLIHENKSVLQSQMAAAKAPAVSAAMSSFPHSEATNTFDWRVLIARFRCLRTYLSGIVKLLKNAEEQYARVQNMLQGQNMEQLQKSKDTMVVLRRMISFLQLTEHQVMLLPKEKCIECINKIIQMISKYHKSNTSSQAPQFSLCHGQVGANSLPSTPVDSTLISKPMISQLPVNQGFPHSQSSATNSFLNVPRNATRQITSQHSLYQGPRGTVNHDTCLNPKQNQQLIQSSSMNQVPSGMHLSGTQQNLLEKKVDHVNSSTDPVSRSCKLECPRGKTSESSHHSIDVHQPSSVHTKQKNDASYRLRSGASSQAKSAVELPLTTVTSSSVPNEIQAPVKPVSSSTKNGDSQISGGGKTRVETKEQGQSTALETHGIPAFSSQVTKQPIERLMEVVQSMSHEALIESVSDIFSAVGTVDRLPVFENDDKFESTMEANLADFLSYSAKAMDYNIDEETQVKKLKRDISLVSSNASMNLDNDHPIYGYRPSSGTKSSNKRPKIEPNNELMDEVRKMNQRLLETVIEVVSDSNKVTGAHETTSGTVVRCTYKPVAIGETFKRHLASAQFAALPVEFLVPPDYPNSSPQILDRLPVGCSEETKDLLEKTQSRFDRHIRWLQQPMSLGDMARAWNDSARSVFSDFSLCIGGKTFSSKYGSWECVPAA